MINLNSLFWTFQGEGFYADRRSLFVRMPYCNLKCSWCDTEFNSFTPFSEDDFTLYAKSEKARFAVITGGEPSLNKHTPKVISLLQALGFEIAMESNGMFAPPPGVDFLTVSPKRDGAYKIHAISDLVAKEFKYVVDEGFNFEILERHNTKDGRRYSLSPEFGRFDKSLEDIFEYIKENPDWKISLQTHKWMKIP